jgi:uncharacterized protein YjiS (DUF1127 family)
MTTLDHGTATMHASTARPVFSTRVVNAVVDFYRAWKNRREVYRLGEMSDSELADIGLTRTDLHVVVGLPFGIDPTMRLGSIAQARADRLEDMARQVC